MTELQQEGVLSTLTPEQTDKLFQRQPRYAAAVSKECVR